MQKDRRQFENNWTETQENLANQSGLALVVMDGAETVSISNNNSICEQLYSSAEFTPLCDKYCGKAYEQATEAEKTIQIRCYAGFHFNVVPLRAKDEQKLAIITGRTFLRAEDYRNATERAIGGDWKQFPPTTFFQNVLLSSSDSEINKVSKRLEKLSDEEKELIFRFKKKKAEKRVEEETENTSPNTTTEDISKLIEEFHNQQNQLKNEQSLEKSTGELEEITAWRSLFSSFLEMEYKEAFVAVAEFLAKRHRLSNLAWLENRENILESIWGIGNFNRQHIQISISAADSRFLEVVQDETSLELRERKTSAGSNNSAQMVNLFPLAVGGGIRSALLIGDEIKAEKTKRQIARFIKQVAPEIEILRLREEIKQHAWVTKAVQKLNQTLKEIDKEDFWMVLCQNAAELMRAERGSILFYDEETNGFTIKAVVGERADIIKMEANEQLGERVAHSVIRSGKPLIVKDVRKAGFLNAPNEWDYKTGSFICYPILMSGRRIGVLNLTDKIDGTSYDERDLEVLQMLAPQIALALDHTSISRRAGELEQLSITDSLTGLVNKRYLKERLVEEISRSQRHGYPMSFVMVDVDFFKSYNDNFGHVEGDKALQLVGQCLKATLRGADVAARYGGEEFSILLPQTTLKEAVTISERIRQRVEKTEFPNRKVTISIGIAAFSANLQDATEIIEAADKALYQAKAKGRNNVQIFNNNGESEE
jgi:diguanylate cyclase (GGDEF)-like protein